jgi:peptidyl-dipeptidase A
VKAREEAARAFIEEHVERIRPLLRESHLADWEAATTGRAAALRRAAAARTMVKQVYSSRDGLARVRRFRRAPTADPRLARELLLLDHTFTANQLPRETIEDLALREAELEGIFYNFRARVGGRALSNNELRERLEGERDSGRRQRIWEASKEIGAQVAPRLRELVRRRNAAARDLGFDDYYVMELTLQEIGEHELFHLLEDFRRRSDDAFLDLRDRLDADLAARFKVAPADLRPWHWDDFFSQEAPASEDPNLDAFFAGVDLESCARDYFAAVGLPIDDVLARSDLYEREGKDQNAFCTDIDREGDVRILCNLRPNERWMRTLLHELGHAAYDRFVPASLPFLLRAPAHTLSTEAIAMYFGRMTRDPQWLRERVGARLDPAGESAVNDQQRLSMLVATRWMLVMVLFERALYRDPDRDDLDRLWWDLVEKIQLIQRPEGRDQPDWATKMHLSLAPVYYHNYLLGELMASQLTQAARQVAGGSAGIGGFLREEVFAHGASLSWNGLLRKSTGEPLSSSHFVEQYMATPLAGSA